MLTLLNHFDFGILVARPVGPCQSHCFLYVGFLCRLNDIGYYEYTLQNEGSSYCHTRECIKKQIFDDHTLEAQKGGIIASVVSLHQTTV